MHGYELIERLPEIAGSETRVTSATSTACCARSKRRGSVSEWSADLPGPAKRTYELTAEGRRLLDRWAESLREATGVIAGFIDRYENSEGR